MSKDMVFLFGAIVSMIGFLLQRTYQTCKRDT
ncbi:hypothetical protein J2S16_000932 [Cytobacillus kochii]|nr:hypothetical protein [Cytobacillus kochii]